MTYSNMISALDTLRQLAAYGTPQERTRALDLSVGLDSFLSRWRAEVLSFVQAGGSELRFIEAPNGRGKTHMLLALQEVASRDGFATCLVDCGLQQKPFESLAETYSAIAKNIQYPGGDGTRGAATLLEAAAPDALSQFREHARQHPAFSNVSLAYAKRSGDRAQQEIALDLRALLHRDTSRRVTFKDLRRRARDLPALLGRVSKRNSAAWLRSLLLLPRWLGYAGLVVLFDETGADFHVRRESLRMRQQHLSHLRQLADRIATGGLPGCAIVYASTPDFVQTAAHDYPALHQRVARASDADTPARNPRAVWCRLDEVTEPPSTAPAFFEMLGVKLINLAQEAKLRASQVDAVERLLPRLAREHSASLVQGAVREFVKTIATHLLCTT